MTGAKPESDPLENAISAASRSDDNEWHESILKLLPGREVYLHLTGGGIPGGQPSMMTSAAGGRDGWILTYTSRRRPGIAYGGVRWQELVTMVGKLDSTPGVRLVNENDDWVILGRDEIAFDN